MTTVEPTVALVFSPEPWVEALHRHLTHHGGARVRQVVVEPAVALDEEYDALVVSDRWPALTLGFVRAVHDRGRRVVGVFDPEEPAGKDHLLTLGVDVTIAGDAPISDFVCALADLDLATGPRPRAASAGADTTADAGGTGDRRLGPLVVVSGPRGSGVTEVAVTLAGAFATRRQPVVLVDVHDAAPSVAGRLGLGLEPNVRSAIDACAHGLGRLDATIALPAGADGPFGVVAGFPSAVAARQVTPADVLDVVTALRIGRTCVVDADDSSPVTSAVLHAAGAVVAVADPSPVGVVRALEWLATVRREVPSTPIHLAVNRAPGARYRREEIRCEVVRTLCPQSIDWLPLDNRVERAAWNGQLVTRGPFHAAVTSLAREVLPAPVSKRRRRKQKA
jgi:MinD-like ATPase involved in chromosome partitioning or flagellar assembly